MSGRAAAAAAAAAAASECKCPGIIQLHVFNMDGINLVLLLTQIQRTGVRPYGCTNPSSGVICAVSSSDPLGEVKGKNPPTHPTMVKEEDERVYAVSRCRGI